MYIEEVLTAHREGPNIALAVMTNCRGRMTAEQMDSFFGSEFVQHLEAFRASLDSGAVSEDELKELWRALQDEQEEKH
jgi:thiamine pyrophosphate-dependent acetolactate synthase large subunit-like protein